MWIYRKYDRGQQTASRLYSRAGFPSRLRRPYSLDPARFIKERMVQRQSWGFNYIAKKKKGKRKNWERKKAREWDAVKGSRVCGFANKLRGPFASRCGSICTWHGPLPSVTGCLSIIRRLSSLLFPRLCATGPVVTRAAPLLYPAGCVFLRVETHRRWVWRGDPGCFEGDSR